MSSPAYLSLSHQLLHHFILLLDYLTTCGIALCMVANGRGYAPEGIAWLLPYHLIQKLPASYKFCLILKPLWRMSLCVRPA